MSDVVKTVENIQKEIRQLAADKDICILAHSYQDREIVEVADFTGDSYKLSVDAAAASNKNIIFCGVHFMAETAKILSPSKQVFLSHIGAGCPMAEQMTPQQVEEIRSREPDRAVVAYINTTAALKTVCDVCVTSSSAVKIVSAMEAKKILFIPDCNLGAFVKAHCPDKDIMLVDGGCPVHAAVCEQEVLAAKKAHPAAQLLCHPECRSEVTAHADYAGSTSGIMQYAKASDCCEFIIGTEMSIAEHLQYECGGKRFYPLSKKLICPDMKLTTLVDVYEICRAIGTEEAAQYEITLDERTIALARGCIDEMLRLGG